MAILDDLAALEAANLATPVSNYDNAAAAVALNVAPPTAAELAPILTAANKTPAQFGDRVAYFQRVIAAKAAADDMADATADGATIRATYATAETTFNAARDTWHTAQAAYRRDISGIQSRLKLGTDGGQLIADTPQAVLDLLGL